MAKVMQRSDSPEATVVGDNALTYNGRKHVARTANDVDIVDGLRVFTNNLDRGTVDLSNATWEWHGPEQVYHLWFDVDLEFDYKGQQATGKLMQSDDRVTTRFDGRAA